MRTLVLLSVVASWFCGCTDSTDALPGADADGDPESGPDAGGPDANPAPGALVQELGVLYGPEATLENGITPRQVGDIYYPAGTEPLAVIVAAHGGGFHGGTRQWLTELCVQLAGRGYLVFNVDYYVNGEERDVVRSHDDFALAVQFIKDHARADPERVALFGTSAGAFMTITFSAAGETSLGDRIAAGVSWSGELIGLGEPESPFQPTATSSPCLMAGYGDIDNPTTASPSYVDYEQPAPEVESEAEYLSYLAFLDAGAITGLAWVKKPGHALSLKGEPEVLATSLAWLGTHLAPPP